MAEPPGAPPAGNSAPAGQSEPAAEAAPENGSGKAPAEKGGAQPEPTGQEPARPAEDTSGEPATRGDGAQPTAGTDRPGEDGGDAEASTPEQGGEGAPNEFRNAVHREEPPVGPPDEMGRVADETGRLGESVTTATDQGEQARANAGNEWRDQAGQDAGHRAAELAEGNRETARLARSVSDAARSSAEQVTEVRKGDEQSLQNGETDWHLARALLPDGEREVAEGETVAATVAETRQRHAAGAAGIREIWNGVAVAEEQPEEPSAVAELAGNLLRTGGDSNVNVGSFLGETSDDIIDGAGSAVGAALDWAGFDEAGKAVTRTADEVGDVLAEETLVEGARIRNAYYDLAQAVDGLDRPRTVYVSHERYPESAQHIDEAQGGTFWRGDQQRNVPRPDPVLTVQREGSEARRAAAIGGIPSKEGFDKDEYPPAVADTTGDKSVKYVPFADNRGAGSAMGHQLNGRDGSIQRQLDGRGMLGDFWGLGRADDGDKFVLRTFR